MKRRIATSIAFTKNLLDTGAIAETSRHVEVEICKHVPKEENKTVVELGVGHGNITREILSRMAPSSKLYAFEINKGFCKHVKKTIKDDRLIIINDGAENIKLHLDYKVDAVISSIPFSFFGKEKGLKILRDVQSLLARNCYLSQVLYTKFNLKKFQQVFNIIDVSKNKNIFTEYIYHCKKL